MPLTMRPTGGHSSVYADQQDWTIYDEGQRLAALTAERIVAGRCTVEVARLCGSPKRGGERWRRADHEVPQMFRHGLGLRGAQPSPLGWRERLRLRRRRHAVPVLQPACARRAPSAAGRLRAGCRC
jgi:hypothetical protein